MRPERHGFALPAVLAVTGVVTLIFLVAITALSVITAEAAGARSRIDFLERALTAEAKISFLLATEPANEQGRVIGGSRADASQPGGDQAEADRATTLAGGSIVRLDGRAYSNPTEGLMIRLQDQAGLINLATLQPSAWRRLVIALGLPAASAEIQRARLEDYVDEDSLRRPNGAESPDYDGYGPANRRLLKTSEWLSVLGLRDEIDRRTWRRMSRFLIFDPRTSSYNLNTAPAESLEIVLGLTTEQTRRTLLGREDAALQTLNDLSLVSGASVFEDELGAYAFPNGKVMFEFRDSKSRWVYSGRISVTPAHLERPLWTDQLEIRQAAPAPTAGQNNAVRFPYAPD